VNKTEREKFAREGATEVVECGVVKGRGHPRAGGRAQLSGRSSERSASERRGRRHSGSESLLSSIRDTPLCVVLPPSSTSTTSSYGEKEEERERTRGIVRNSLWSKRGEEQKGSLAQYDVFRRVLVGVARAERLSLTGLPSIAPRGGRGYTQGIRDKRREKEREREREI